PLLKTVRKLERFERGLSEVYAIWKAAQSRSGERIPVTGSIKQAKRLSNYTSSIDSNFYESRRLQEGLGLVSITGIWLAVVGGLPMLLGGLTRLALALRMKTLENGHKSAAHLFHVIEKNVI